METSFKRIALLVFLCGLTLLAACGSQITVRLQPAAAAAPTTATVATAAADASAKATAAFTDPFAYCNAVGTIDQPDARYTGPKTPDAVVKGVMQASGAPADAPLQVYSQGTVWRCMDHQVYACFVGANLPCELPANTSQEPTAAMNEVCQANPNLVGIAASVTGHDTIYAWACKDGKAVIDRQVWHVDAQGYIQEIWYPIQPPTQ